MGSHNSKQKSQCTNKIRTASNPWIQCPNKADIKTKICSRCAKIQVQSRPKSDVYNRQIKYLVKGFDVLYDIHNFDVFEPIDTNFDELLFIGVLSRKDVKPDELSVIYQPGISQMMCAKDDGFKINPEKEFAWIAK